MRGSGREFGGVRGRGGVNSPNKVTTIIEVATVQIHFARDRAHGTVRGTRIGPRVKENNAGDPIPVPRMVPCAQLAQNYRLDDVGSSFEV